MDSKATGHLEEVEGQWATGLGSLSPTESPNIQVDGANMIATLAVVIIGVLVTMAILFGMAIFIDCRHQRINQDKDTARRKKNHRLKLPVFIRNMNNEDMDTITDDVDQNQTSSSQTTCSQVLTINASSPSFLTNV